MLRQQTTERPADVLTLNILSNRGRTIRPKTLDQKRYVDAIDEHTIVFGIGPAGTGKTYLAMAKAVQALQAKQVNRIILTRPAVEAGERLGFLPGTLTEKIDPYLRPLYDALHEMIDPESIPRLMAAGTIEVAPLAYMRGRTLNDAFIILDEAQNTTPEQMKMFLTRLGFGAKMVVTGDITQVDLPAGTQSGLRIVRDILDGHRGRPLLRADQRRRRPAPAGRRDRRRLQPLGRRPGRHRAGRGRPARRDVAAPAAATLSRSDAVSIEVNNESGVEVDEAEIVALARHVLAQMHVHPQAELSIVLVDEAAMEQLHVQWMDEPGPTDVLSLPDGRAAPRHRGEEPARRAARRRRAVPAGRRARRPGRRGHTTQDELLLLTTHGILHLLGFDHAEPDEETEMFGLQRKLLLTFLAGREAAGRRDGGAVSTGDVRLVVVALVLVLARRRAGGVRGGARPGLPGPGRRAAGRGSARRAGARPGRGGPRADAVSVSTFLRVLAETGAAVLLTVVYLDVIGIGLARGRWRRSPR